MADLVYKDDCALCFATPESPNGILICVDHRLGFCPQHVKIHDCHKFLQYIRRRRRLKEGRDSSSAKSDAVANTDSRPKNQDDAMGSPSNKISKLGIGIEGGLSLDTTRFETVEKYYLFANYPNENSKKEISVEKCPDPVVDRIIKAESAYKKREIDTMSSTWDGSVRFITKHANIEQFKQSEPICLTQCEAEACTKTENLWLNLTDGSVFCGRKFADGSGGNGHAKEHYELTGFPLVVNLGTLSPDVAEIYSYDPQEDDMVIDPNLDDHLKFFGLNRYTMVKTEKTILEKELEFNISWEYSSIQEDGKVLVPVYGPGFVGIHNLGNSCYINSFIQALGQMVRIQNRIDALKNEIFAALNARCNPFEDFKVQLIKLLTSLQCATYSCDPATVEKKDDFEAPENGVRPLDFRHLIGRDHSEFSTKRQQDVEEFAHYLADLCRIYFGPSANPLLPLNHLALVKTGNQANDYYKIQCVYDVIFPIDDEMVAASSSADKEKPRRNLVAQMKKMIENPASAVMGCASLLCTFPQYFLIKFYQFKVNRHAHHGPNNRPLKLAYALEVEEKIDFGFLRHKGFFPSTELDASKIVISGHQETLATIKRSRSKSPARQADDHEKDSPAKVTELRAQLAAIGCDIYKEVQLKKALRSTNNIEMAINFLMDGQADDVAEEKIVQPTQASSATGTVSQVKLHDTLADVSIMIKELKAMDNTRTIYSLKGIISHIGASTDTGHYVFHAKKGDKWYIFNDEKVACSKNPPKEFGYVYVFERHQ
uniref:Ubiquitin carboxyl-terminal hydrolase n=1 Tax=Romanomermis culicivorax TaxID=13658 RepID=A0A915J2Y5_ROMCU